MPPRCAARPLAHLLPAATPTRATFSRPGALAGLSSTGLALAALLASWSGAALAEERHLLRSFQTIRLTGDFHCEGAHFADFNQDGQGDVVAGPYIYYGPEFKERREIYPAKAYDPKGYSENFLTYTHDFNGDKLPDVLQIGFPGKETYWYANPGKAGEASQGAAAHWPRHLATPVTDNESPMLVNLVGDDRPELVFHTGGYLGWAAPVGDDPTKPWVFHRLSEKGSWQRFTHGIGVGDVNGDGRADLLMNEGWWEQPESLESDPVWKKHEQRFAESAAQMFTDDVDGDGDNDVITALQAHGFGLAWHENHLVNGVRQFKQHRFMHQKAEDNKYGVMFTQPHAVELVDIDGDGLKDILTGKRFWAHGPNGDAHPSMPAVVYWFQLTRSGVGAEHVDYVPRLIHDDSGVGTQVAAGDLNGDKLVDVVVGNKKGAFVHLQQVKEVSKAEWEAAQPKPLK